MYQFYSPAIPLRPYIENYWILKTQSSQDMPIQEAIFVDGRADILINFGVSYLRGNPQHPLVPITFSNLDAQRTYPVVIHQIGAIHLIGVRFKIGGLAPFIRYPLYELSDNVFPLGDILGQGACDLEEQLYDIPNPSAQIGLLDAFFLKLLRLHDSYQLVMTISRQLIARQLSIQQISADMGYSIRSVDRLFRQMMGFSPKFYARIARVEAVIETLYKNPIISMAELALKFGYYDQAHFSKEFKDFTGQTPLAYREKLRQPIMNPAPNLVQFLQDPVPEFR
ncbi:MAG: AraC family transcriptional regulator [bacterium]|nr:AraC family transcriptional regulator [bacterium]